MEKQIAADIIKDTFSQPFEEERYVFFLKNLLNDYDESKEREWSQGNYIYEAFREHINRYKRPGVYTDPDGNEVELLIVETKENTKLERARTSLRNFIIRRLNEKERDYALVAFYAKDDKGADWRFSFIKIEHESYKNEKGRVKTRKELTPARRYSYLVGENEHTHTAQRQLLPVLVKDYAHPTVEELEEAFGIEKITDEFFEQYKGLYLKLSEHFEKNRKLKTALAASGVDVQRFAKKLLGQIVFIYFLQKKGWLGVPKNEAWGKGDKKFMQSLYDETEENRDNFFDGYLKYLFYEALAKQRTNSADPAYYKRFDCKIPFLNGGLFEADYDWKNTDLKLPNELFRNEEKNKSGDKGTGVLDVFDRYNFTIKEDEPLEKDVAVDPEMLGKVFENMLEVTERKSKGAFYTPREIVHYMCRESLVHYLDNNINPRGESHQPIDSDQAGLFAGSHKKGQGKLEITHRPEATVPLHDIEELVRKGYLAIEHDRVVAAKGKETEIYSWKLPETVRQHADRLDELLADIKICDPAIGSGAFPVGLLQELVTAQRALEEHLGDSYRRKKLKKIGLEEKEYKKDPGKYIYRIKRHAIQESIYGVDIDPSAIDIARLRLWLSMVVDEEDFYNIEALPNLDYKIVCGNALIGFPEGYEPRWLDYLEEKKREFFDCTEDGKKSRLRKEINTKIADYLQASEKSLGYKVDFDFKLFFSEVWHYKNGFDIVIGNPPYLRIQGIKEYNRKLADTLLKTYSSATGSFDLYVCFTEKGMNVLRPNGMLTFIMPIKWLNASFGKGLRSFIVKNNATKKIISFGAYQVFNASTYTGIQFFQRNSTHLEYHELNKNLLTNRELEIYLADLNEVDLTVINNKELSDTPWTLTDVTTSGILNKLYKHKKRVKDIFEKFFTGLQTSKDSVYFLENCKDNGSFLSGYSAELDEEIEIELALVKPLLKGDQIHRYDKLYTHNYVIFPYYFESNKAVLYDEKTLKKMFPLGYKYLKKNESILRNRENGKLGNDVYWYRYIYPKNLTLFDKQKIITPYISRLSQLSIDKSGTFAMNTKCFGLILKKEYSIDYYYPLLAILNAEICWYFIRSTGTVFRGGYYAYTPDYLNPFPVPVLNSNTIRHLNVLVSYLFDAKNRDSIVFTYFEQVNDAIVYELYFPDELKAAGKEIIKHLGELKPIDDSMSDEQKLAIIQREFNRLYDPNHPVRNNIETLDSVEEVRIIREALK